MKITITEVKPPAAAPPISGPRDPRPFSDVIEKLRTVYGDDQVFTGGAVPADRIDALARELGMELPADYRAFLATWGYLCAGPRGEVIVFGVPPDSVNIGYEVDVLRAKALLAQQIESHGDALAAVATDGPLVPVFCAGESFPSHSLHVLDGAGELRWLLVAEHSLEPGLGISFGDFLADHIEALFAVDHHQRLLASAEPSARHHDEYRRLIPISAPVLAAIERAPAMLETYLLYDTGAELRALIEGGLDADELAELADADDPETQAILALLATPGLREHAPLTGPELEADDAIGALIYTLTGTDEPSALTAGQAIARALCGDTALPAAEHRSRLIQPAHVKRLAHALATVEDDIYARFSDEDEYFADHYGNDLDEMVELATRLRDAYRDAARRGDAMLVRYSIY